MSDHLASLDLLSKIATELNTKFYIWGGLSQDIYEGKILREHSDVDCLMLNMRNLCAKIEKLFTEEGWQIKKVNGILSIKRGDNKIHLGNIENYTGELFKWTFLNFSDNQDFVSFPKDWVSNKPKDFYGLRICVAEPEFEYAVRIYPNKLNPRNKIREKDKIAIDYYEGRLLKKYKNSNEVLEKMKYPNELAFL